MSDGCWVQFWDDDDCEGATLRIDAEGSSLVVNDLDKYIQSDGDKEGNEPDSLETGSRSWLMVYKDKNCVGAPNASFGPNSKIDDLDKYGVGGNISSFKLFDSRPIGFVDSSSYSTPAAVEAEDGLVNAQSVNGFFRTVIVESIGLIPEVGGFLGGIVEGLWPDVDNRDQVWACYQNYLNKLIVGVYWQSTYEKLNDALKSIYKAADAYNKTPEEDHEFKIQTFENLYNIVNNMESFFVDENNPQTRYMFLVPFATLRLATLRENLEHYAFYYGAEPSAELRKELAVELRDSINLYRRLLAEARDRIVAGRGNQIVITEQGISRTPYVLDKYNGFSMAQQEDVEYRRDQYSDGVLNLFALDLDKHNAIGQLWEYFDVNVQGPAQPPILRYAVGPYGWYQNVDKFKELATSGRITEVSLWTGSLVDSLEISVDGVGQGRVGSSGGGGLQSLSLAADECVASANGYQTGLINALGFVTDKGRSLYGGSDGGQQSRRFEVKPLPETLNTRLVGLSGYAGVGSGSNANIKAITFHWDCELVIKREEAEAS